MATPVSASSSPIKETPQNEDPKEHPRMKAVHIILMIVILAMSLAAYSSVFGLHFTQTKIDKNGQNVFEQHKTKTIDSVDSAIRVVRTFPDLVKQEKLDGLSTELLKLLYKELKIDDLKDKRLLGMSDQDFESYKPMLLAIKSCPEGANILTEKENITALFNNPKNLHKTEVEKVLAPFVEVQTSLNETIKRESETPGRLSKPNMEGYSGSMTTMLNEFKTSTVKKDDYYIKSFNNQIDLQNSSIFHQLIFIIVSILIGFVLYGIQVGTFVGFTKESISPKSYKLISNILIGICGFFVLIYLIFAVLGSIGMSPFAYQCELQAESQNSNSKFQNFNGESAKIQSITSECEKGQKVYQKMAANLNRDKIVGHLNGYESGVERIVATLQNINIVLDKQKIRDLRSELEVKNDGFVNAKKCLTQRNDIRSLDGLLRDLETNKVSLEYLVKVPENINNQMGTLMPKVNKLIDDSFVKYRNTTGKVVDSINSQLQSTDISCQIENLPGLCIEYDKNWMKINLINWIIFGNFVALFVYAIMNNQIVKSDIEHNEKIEALLFKIHSLEETIKALMDDNRREICRLEERIRQLRKKLREIH